MDKGALFPRWPRSSATVEDYADLVRRLGKRFGSVSGWGVEGWFEWLERLRVQPWSVATVRRYRAALLWFLESMDTFPGSPFWVEPEQRERVLAAIYLPWVGESEVLSERKKLPGKRMHSFGKKRWRVLRERLLDERDALSDETVLWMEAAMRVGVRPVEWVRGCTLQGLHPGRGGILRIPCAKGAFGTDGARIRGLAEFRELNLEGWPEAERSIVALWVGLRDTREGRAALLKAMAKRLRRVWDAEFGSLRPRITLYTARHQFVANLRAMGMDAVTIAALMGHSSDQTQRTHYGRGAYGRAGGGVTPPLVPRWQVKLVRCHAPGSHPAKG